MTARTGNVPMPDDLVLRFRGFGTQVAFARAVGIDACRVQLWTIRKNDMPPEFVPAARQFFAERDATLAPPAENEASVGIAPDVRPYLLVTRDWPHGYCPLHEPGNDGCSPDCVETRVEAGWLARDLATYYHTAYWRGKRRAA